MGLANIRRVIAQIGSTIADGGVTTAKLAASAVETAKIADNAVTAAKIADAAAIAATQLEGLADGQVIVGVDGTGANNAKVTVTGDITMTNGGVTALNAAHEEQTVIIPVEDLAESHDIVTRPIFVHPRAVTLVSIGILTQGAPAGVNDGNTSVFLVTDDAANLIVTKTYNTGTQPPTSDYEDLGALDGTHKVLTAGEHLLLSVTNGAMADLPAFLLIIRYVPTNA